MTREQRVHKQSETSGPIGLGRRLAVYRQSPLGGLGAFGITSLLGIIVGPLWLVDAVRTLAKDGLAPFLGLEPLFLAVCAPLWFIWGLFVLAMGFLSFREYVATHENGFSYSLYGAKGYHSWDQIASIQHIAYPVNDSRGQYQRTLHTFNLSFFSTPNLHLGQGIIGGFELGSFIQQATKARLLAACVSDTGRRRKVTFGPITVGAKGMTVGTSSLTWNELASIAHEPRKGASLFSVLTEIEDVVIRSLDSDSPWAVVPVSDVPNDFLLSDLAQHFQNPGAGRDGAA
jgi:hypothetical protein